MSDTLFATASIEAVRRADGTILLHSRQPLGPYPQTINSYLVHWAHAAPGRPFLLERTSGKTWSGVTYREALSRVQRIASTLLEHSISPAHPIAILSDNSVEHGLLMLAAMHVGIPVASISSAYSLVSSDFGKLKSIVHRLTPALIYADDFDRYAPALYAIAGLHRATVVAGGSGPRPESQILRFAELEHAADAHAVAQAFERVTSETIAKVLFTSGSTDEPKGVINTQRMLCASQQAKAQVWPFLETEPPVLVDWLPWNHTFGGNHNFNLVLRNGGTLYIDGGKPVPGLFSRTVENLQNVAPTVYFNVPRGYELLIEGLRSRPELRTSFFRRLRLIFYAGATLPAHLWDALVELAVQTKGAAVPLVSAWGSTETSPLATSCYGDASGPGVIGLPVPGCELKLLPNGEKMEVRVRGPNVFPGYWRRPDLTARHFDEEGFYCIGDAVRFVAPEAPELGLVFDGRVSEDFKLTTGTWVSVGNLIMHAIAALAPVAQDVVVAGHDRAEARLLIFPNITSCRALCPDLQSDTPIEALLAQQRIRDFVSAALQALRRDFPGSSTHATGAILLQEPPSIDAGEITDKGYINQRAVLTRRKGYVDALFSAGHPSLITPKQ
jgi:feruloyl-CoA synthase